MPYSRTLAPVLLWLLFMLTSADNQTCPPWLQPHGQEEVVSKYVEQFSQILIRFDCPQPYSVKFQCHQCKEAYKMWVCTTFYKYQVEYSNTDSNLRSIKPQYSNTDLRTIKPCRSFCHEVEQKCPFFLPLDKGPVHYAGEPAFLCLDPNIEETGEQLEKSSYGPSTCCYDACGSDVCLQGNCEVAEAVTDSETSSSSSSRTLVATPLIVPLLLYRTRLLLI